MTAQEWSVRCRVCEQPIYNGPLDSNRDYEAVRQANHEHTPLCPGPRPSEPQPMEVPVS